MTRLYSFERLKCTNAGAPRAIPSSGSSISRNSSDYIFRDSLTGNTSGLIDVINDFQWTTSPPGPDSRQEVPRIVLREKRLRANAIIAAAAYYLMSGSSSAGTLAARGASITPDFVNNTISGIINNPAIQNIASGAGSFLTQGILNAATTFTTGRNVNNILSSTVEGLNSEFLKAYEGLYLTEDTKFVYYLPYFDDVNSSVKNEFTENDATFKPGTKAYDAMEKMRGAAEYLARAANFAEPGVYIERPKFYSFQSTGDTISFSFPLINTGWATYADVCKNWQLVFLLTYQNRPNRRSRELIDPVCLYEVNIPGVKYIPYAFINSLSVKYAGARRHMDLDVPVMGGTSTITTIVPDAYIIDISITGLVAESQNFLMAAIGDKEDIVKVENYNRYNPFASIINSFEDSLLNERANLNSNQ